MLIKLFNVVGDKWIGRLKTLNAAVILGCLALYVITVGLHMKFNLNPQLGNGFALFWIVGLFILPGAIYLWERTEPLNNTGNCNLLLELTEKSAAVKTHCDQIIASGRQLYHADFIHCAHIYKTEENARHAKIKVQMLASNLAEFEKQEDDACRRLHGVHS